MYSNYQGWPKYAVTLALLIIMNMSIAYSSTADAEVDVPPGGFFMLWELHLMPIWKSIDLGRPSKVPSLVLFYSKTFLLVPGAARSQLQECCVDNC